MSDAIPGFLTVFRGIDGSTINAKDLLVFSTAVPFLSYGLACHIQ
jgi:hypothetical protein